MVMTSKRAVEVGAVMLGESGHGTGGQREEAALLEGSPARDWAVSQSRKAYPSVPRSGGGRGQARVSCSRGSREAAARVAAMTKIQDCAYPYRMFQDVSAADERGEEEGWAR